jgi:hypothetical protein
MSNAYRKLHQYDSCCTVDALMVVLCRVQTLINAIHDRPDMADLFGSGQEFAGVSVTVLQSLDDGNLRVEIAPDP